MLYRTGEDIKRAIQRVSVNINTLIGELDHWLMIYNSVCHWYLCLAAEVKVSSPLPCWGSIQSLSQTPHWPPGSEEGADRGTGAPPPGRVSQHAASCKSTQRWWGRRGGGGAKCNHFDIKHVESVRAIFEKIIQFKWKKRSNMTSHRADNTNITSVKVW